MSDLTPWILKTKLDKKNQLFKGTFDTSCVVNAFRCSCGHTKLITTAHNDEDLHYVCPECVNSSFLDANDAKKSIDYFVSAHYGSCDFLFRESIDKIEIYLLTCIPISIDFLRGKINMKTKIFNCLQINFNGEVKKNYLNLFDYEQARENMEDKLMSCLNANAISLYLSTSKTKKQDIKKLEFYYRCYLEHFILNQRKEKSLRKAFFNNYKVQMKHSKQYDPYLVMLFIKKIKDINILVKFIKLSLHKYNIIKYYVAILLDFLLIAYTEKQILELFHQVEYGGKHDASLFNDILRMLKFFPETEFCNEKKPKCNLKDLHNSIISYTKKEKEKEIIGKTIDISRHNLKPCVQIDGYEVRLPKTGDELYEWANQLQNCMVSYFNAITNNETSIYCFLKNESIDFAVEIKNKSVVQVKGIANARLNSNQYRVLQKWLKRFFSDEAVSCDKNTIPIEMVND